MEAMMTKEERLTKLRELIEQLKGESFGEQYGLADWAESDPKINEQLNDLSKETAFYQKLLRELEEDMDIAKEVEEDDGLPF
jgi:hypothetical protein